MSVTTPDHWWPDPQKSVGLKARLKTYAMAPAALVYGHIVASRMAQIGEAPTIPVICVGNFVAGGAGKTPTALALYDYLRDLSMEPAYVTRGYGGSLATNSFRVDYERHKASEVGDEPLLLARKGMTFVGPDRMRSIDDAAEMGATCAIFDDGLQNPSVAKNLSIAVVDGRLGVGNGFSHPAGPLRAPIGAQLDHIDMVVAIGKGKRGHSVIRQAAKRGKTILPATLDMAIPEDLYDKPIYAFCGIGNPSKFFDRLREAGLNIVKEKGYDDHHLYTTEDARELMGIAKERKAVLVTTEKDAMRFRGHSGTLRDLQQACVQIPATLRFEDPSFLRSILRNAISSWRRDLALVQID